MIDGKQRLRNIRTKNNLITQREIRQFRAGEINMLPCSGDREREFIEKEFDRIANAQQH